MKLPNRRPMYCACTVVFGPKRPLHARDPLIDVRRFQRRRTRKVHFFDVSEELLRLPARDDFVENVRAVRVWLRVGIDAAVQRIVIPAVVRADHCVLAYR